MNKQKSFTLIELLVVIVIIGILAGVIMISTSSSIDKANIAKLKAFEESVQNNLAANMVSRWRLDEVIGGTAPYKTPDQWGSSIGILGDGTTTTTYPTLLSESECVSGKCMKFDGADDYINAGNNANFNNLPLKDFAINAWIKNGRNGDWGTIFGTYSSPNGWNFRTLNNSVYFDVVYPGGTTAIYRTSSVATNVWLSVLITWDMKIKSAKIYLNGIEANYATATPGVGTYGLDTSLKKEIGRIPHGGGVHYFYGLIDDVRIFNAIPSSSQIKQNYIAGLNSMLANGNISKQEYNERINALAYDN